MVNIKTDIDTKTKAIQEKIEKEVHEQSQERLLTVFIFLLFCASIIAIYIIEKKERKNITEDKHINTEGNNIPKDTEIIKENVVEDIKIDNNINETTVTNVIEEPKKSEITENDESNKLKQIEEDKTEKTIKYENTKKDNTSKQKGVKHNSNVKVNKTTGKEKSAKKQERKNLNDMIQFYENNIVNNISKEALKDVDVLNDDEEINDLFK